MSPPRSGSHFLQYLLADFFPARVQTATYHNQQPFSSNIFMVKSHADTYLRLLNEVSALQAYPLFPSKFLIIVRDPRIASISAYEYGGRKLGKSQEEFLFSSNYGPDCPGLFKGNYLSYLKKFFETWLQYCQKSGAMIVKFENLVTDHNCFKKVLEYLELKIEKKLLKADLLYAKVNSISRLLEEKWRHAARFGNSKTKTALPQKQYLCEFGDLKEYTKITQIIEVEFKDTLENLGYY